MMLLARNAEALDPSRTIDQFTQTAWTQADGAPQDIWALAQTRDGYLWIGAFQGLYRFDGINFEKMEGFRALPSRSDGVSALFVSKAGDLWIGHVWGGLTLYRNGHFEDANPVPAHGAVLKIVQDPSGGIWAATIGKAGNSLRHFDGRHWDIYEGSDLSIPKETASDLLAAQDGSLWMVGKYRLARLPPGGGAFETLSTAIGSDPAIVQTRDGQVWLEDGSGLRPWNAPPHPPQEGGADDFSMSLIEDRDGALWTVNERNGITRIRHPALFAKGSEQEEDTAREHLFSTASGAVFEDREGNIWAATSSGLGRFKAANLVTHLATNRGMTSFSQSKQLFRSQEGDVYGLWHAESRHTLFRDHDGIIEEIPDVASDGMTLCSAADGGVWLVDVKRRKMTEMRGKVVVRSLPGPPAVSIESPARNCSDDGRGGIWVSTQMNGLVRFDGRDWVEVPDTRAWLLEADRKGRLLLYYGTHSLVRMDGERRETIWDEKDISIRFINAIYVAGDLAYLAGEQGLAVYDGSGIKTLDSGRFPFLNHITGIAQTEAGETWMLTGMGVVRLSSAELAEAFDHPDAELHPHIFNYQDGLRGQGFLGETNAVVAARDGRVWVNATGGLLWIDPTHLYQNDLAPEVVVRGLAVDGTTLKPSPRMRLEEGVSSLQFDYTALSLTAPERVMFRYRLEGVDKDWVEAGGRRQAFYTNLAPGSYRFRVIASNNDGVWNTVGAAMEIEIPPTFLQSRWFFGLCAAAVIASLWLLYHLRVRQLAARLRLGMTARLEERERIARELHDTLLQGVQGLIFRFQAISGQISAELPARAQMERALDQADELLAEGRDRVVNLRAIQAEGDLGKLLDAAAARILGGSNIEVNLATEGEIRQIASLVAEEIVRIGDEFLFNTLQHAAARKVEILIKHGAKTLLVQFSDDGRGIDPKVLDPGGRDGHFGLRGMRERAEKIGGHFTLMSRVGAGVELTLAIPAAMAYRRATEGAA